MSRTHLRISPWRTAIVLTALAVLAIFGGNVAHIGSLTPAASWSQINGFPDASDTGVPANTTLTKWTGPSVITANKTILNHVIAGCIEIDAYDVVIEDSYLACQPGGTGVVTIDQAPAGQPWFNPTITDTEIDGMDSSNPTNGCDTAATFGVWAYGQDANVTGTRLNIHGVSDGWKTDGKLQESYIWDLNHFGPDTSCGTHNEDVVDNGEDLSQTGASCGLPAGQQCNPGLQVLHNTLLNKNDQTGAVTLFNDFGPITNVTVDSNFMAGGDWTIYGGCVTGKAAPFGVNTTITNNVMSTGYFPKVGQYGPDAYDCTGTGDVDSNNNVTSIAPPPDPTSTAPSPTSTAAPTSTATPAPTAKPNPASPSTPAPTPSPTPAPTQTVTPGSGVLVGNSSVESGPDNDATGSAEALQYTAASSGNVGSLSLYVDSGNAAKSVVVGLYSDNAGKPGALLAQGTISSPKAGAWNTVSVDSASVTAGNKYWLALLGLGGDVHFRDLASGGGGTYNSAQSNLTDLPSTWTNGAQWHNSPASFYATVAATSTPSPTSSPTPTPTPSPTKISNVPCTVTINGVQETGTCSGTFTPEGV